MSPPTRHPTPSESMQAEGPLGCARCRTPARPGSGAADFRASGKSSGRSAQAPTTEQVGRGKQGHVEGHTAEGLRGAAPLAGLPVGGGQPPPAVAVQKEGNYSTAVLRNCSSSALKVSFSGCLVRPNCCQAQGLKRSSPSRHLPVRRRGGARSCLLLRLHRLRHRKMAIPGVVARLRIPTEGGSNLSAHHRHASPHKAQLCLCRTWKGKQPRYRPLEILQIAAQQWGKRTSCQAPPQRLQRLLPPDRSAPMGSAESRAALATGRFQSLLMQSTGHAPTRRVGPGLNMQAQSQSPASSSTWTARCRHSSLARIKRQDPLGG